MCGTPGESLACSYTAGEVTRAVLAPLTLAGRTPLGDDLPAGAAVAGEPRPRVVVPGGGERNPGGSGGAADPGATWTRIEFAVPADPGGPGGDVQVLGVRMTFGGQAWIGQVYLDELTWH